MADAVAEQKTDEKVNTTAAPADGKADTPAPDTTKVEAKADDKTILGDDSKEQPKTDDKKSEEVKTGAPEKYADFVLPEGQSVNKELLEKALPLFKELGLSQENAQKLVALQAESAKSYAETTLANFNEQIKTWKDDSTKMFGAKANEEFGIAAQAINRFGTPELKAVLNETGLGNHPELVKFFNQVGHAIKEENPVDGKRVEEKRSDADLFYGSTMKSKK